MTLYQNILMWVLLAAAFGMAAAGVVVWCDMREMLPGRRILHAFLRLPWLVRLFLVAFVVQLVVHGSTKTNATNGVEGGTTNPPAMMGSGVAMPGVGHARYGVASVADADIARGYHFGPLLGSRLVTFRGRGSCDIIPHELERKSWL